MDYSGVSRSVAPAQRMEPPMANWMSASLDLSAYPTAHLTLPLGIGESHDQWTRAIFSPPSSAQQTRPLLPNLEGTSSFPTPASSSSLPQPKLPSKKRSHDDKSASPNLETESVDSEDRETKRARNTAAARRYRQRKVDRLSELEEALASMTRERDDLRLKLARSEAEAGVLRGMVGKGAASAS